MAIGFWQLVLIILIILLLFGAGKMPKVMSDLAKSIKLFRSEMGKDTQNQSKTKKTKKNNKI